MTSTLLPPLVWPCLHSRVRLGVALPSSLRKEKLPLHESCSSGAPRATPAAREETLATQPPPGLALGPTHFVSPLKDRPLASGQRAPRPWACVLCRTSFLPAQHRHAPEQEGRSHGTG